MKKNIKKIVLLSLLAVSVCSCGSTWTISGNEVIIEKCHRDTIVPAGTVILKSAEPLNLLE